MKRIARNIVFGLALAACATVASAGTASESSSSGSSFVDLVLCTFGIDAYCAPDMSALENDPLIRNRPG